MTVKREINESPVKQGENEVISYTLNTAPWGGAPDNVAVLVFDYSERIMDDDSNVTADVMPVNDPDVDEDVITLSPLRNLVAGTRYRVNVQWTSAGNTFEAYSIVDGEV